MFVTIIIKLMLVNSTYKLRKQARLLKIFSFFSFRICNFLLTICYRCLCLGIINEMNVQQNLAFIPRLANLFLGYIMI